jgi:hypothetical protein
MMTGKAILGLGIVVATHCRLIAGVTAETFDLSKGQGA